MVSRKPWRGAIRRIARPTALRNFLNLAASMVSWFRGGCCLSTIGFIFAPGDSEYCAEPCWMLQQHLAAHDRLAPTRKN
jgi:hypothetical protein